LAVHLITGGAGFVAVNLTRQLLQRGESVLAIDNLSRGRREFLREFSNSNGFVFVEMDCADGSQFLPLIESFHSRQRISEVWHLAANSDIPAGVSNPRIDLKDTFLTTFETLLLMRDLEIPILHFASSSAVYGDLKDLAISETSGPAAPISNYGAMKLASEAQIRAAAECFLERANIFRFPNVVGTPATHGVILDLIRKARTTPSGFEVLGDGTQRKIYLHVDDLVEAMLCIRDQSKDRYSVFNIGPSDDGITVREIAESVRDEVAPHAKIRYGVGNKGWVGDVPTFRYAVEKVSSLGWTPRLGSKEAVRGAVKQIAAVELR
jgi:UDP-glucose 4-epimerase